MTYLSRSTTPKKRRSGIASNRSPSSGLDVTIQLPRRAPVDGRAGFLDKPGGLAITSDGRVFTVIDNDRVDDASGETQLLLLSVKDDLT